MEPQLREEDRKLASKVIDLLQVLDGMAVEQRLHDNDAARNLADAAASLRRWLDELGLGPRTEPQV